MGRQVRLYTLDRKLANDSSEIERFMADAAKQTFAPMSPPSMRRVRITAYIFTRANLSPVALCRRFVKLGISSRNERPFK